MATSTTAESWLDLLDAAVKGSQPTQPLIDSYAASIQPDSFSNVVTKLVDAAWQRPALCRPVFALFDKVSIQLGAGARRTVASSLQITYQAREQARASDPAAFHACVVVLANGVLGGFIPIGVMVHAVLLSLGQEDDACLAGCLELLGSRLEGSYAQQLDTWADRLAAKALVCSGDELAPIVAFLLARGKGWRCSGGATAESKPAQPASSAGTTPPPPPAAAAAAAPAPAPAAAPAGLSAAAATFDFRPSAASFSPAATPAAKATPAAAAAADDDPFADFIAPDEEEEFDARYLEQFDQLESNGGFKARMSFVSREIAALDPSFVHDPSEPSSPATPTDIDF